MNVVTITDFTLQHVERLIEEQALDAQYHRQYDFPIEFWNDETNWVIDDDLIAEWIDDIEDAKSAERDAGVYWRD